MFKIASCMLAVVVLVAAGCDSSDDSSPPAVGTDAAVEAQGQSDTGTGSDVAAEADAVVHNEAGIGEDSQAETSATEGGSDAEDAAPEAGADADDAAPEGGGGAAFGTTCTDDKECTSNVCHLFPGNGERKCSETCTGPSTCPSGSEGQKCNGEGFCKP